MTQYISLHNMKLTPAHIGQDWEKVRDFQQSIASLSLNLKDQMLSFNVLQREELGILDYLWSFLLGDKIHFQIDAIKSNSTKPLFSIVLLDTELFTHNFITDQERHSPAQHQISCKYRAAVRVSSKGQIVPSTMQDETDMAMARLVYVKE